MFQKVIFLHFLIFKFFSLIKTGNFNVLYKLSDVYVIFFIDNVNKWNII